MLLLNLGAHKPALQLLHLSFSKAKVLPDD
jgi:hypothetical protein